MSYTENFLNLRQLLTDAFLENCRVYDDIVGLLEKGEDEAGAERLLSKVRSATKELRKFQKGVLKSQPKKGVVKRNRPKKS